MSLYIEQWRRATSSAQCSAMKRSITTLLSSAILIASVAGAQNNSLVNTTSFAGVVSDYGNLSGPGFWSSAVGTEVSGTFTIDMGTLGSPAFSTDTENEWIQADELAIGPLLQNTIPANNIGKITVFGQGGSFSASSLQFMTLGTGTQTLGWGGAPLQFNTNDASFIQTCSNVSFPITVSTAFPLSLVAGCTTELFLSYNLNQYAITVNLTSLGGSPVSCPASTVYPAVFEDGTLIRAFFTPSNGNVTSYATLCNYDEIDWQQVITHAPPLNGPKPLTPQDVSGNVMDGTQEEGCVDMDGFTWNGNCSVFVEGNAPVLYDPPPGGDVNSGTGEANSYPFYYPESEWDYFDEYCVSVTMPQRCATGELPYVLSADGTTMWYADGPHNTMLPGVGASSNPNASEYLAFTTRLVGLSTQRTTGSFPCGPSNNQYVGGQQYFCTVIHSFSWNSTFNGQACSVPLDSQNRCPGVSILAEDASLFPIIPGSGTGGVTITEIDGVSLPPSVSGASLTVTASGLTYSRLSQTFNGTITLKNISATTLSGPLQVVLFGPPLNVTLVNQTGNLSGTPYLTVPVASGLAPGSSVTVPVQFKNPGNAAINLVPTVYAGTID